MGNVGVAKCLEAKTEFDIIVVGAGAAGCVVASRLSENEQVSVLLVEAGGDHQQQRVRSPFFGSTTLQSSDLDYGYQTEVQEVLKKRMNLPRGKVVGGCSAINQMIWVRGDPCQWDHFASQGCVGWSYEDVVGYFKKSETFLGPDDDDLRGKDGPVKVSCSKDFRLGTQKTCELFMESCSKCGIPMTSDYNGGRQEGVSMIQANTEGGIRCDVATAYLVKTGALQRPNLTLWKGATATRILMEGNRAVGLEMQLGDQLRTARAGSEVVLCCGAIGSPQLLMLSGIGPKEHLEEMGIECKQDSPGVGNNLQDHVLFPLNFAIKKNMRLPMNPQRGWSRGFLGSLLQYAFGEGVFSFPPVGAVAFTHSAHSGLIVNEPQEGNDIQFHMLPFRSPFTSFKPFAREDEAIVLYPTLLLARSTGTLRLASRNPYDHPILDPRYLTDERDLQVGVCAFKKAREITKTEPLSDWVEREEFDPEIHHDPESDEYMQEYIKRHLSTVFHQSCTAKMGPDEDAEAVVDLKLKVRGVDGLRVADASIMPTVITANIQAAVIMIGERAADFILSDLKGVEALQKTM